MCCMNSSVICQLRQYGAIDVIVVLPCDASIATIMQIVKAVLLMGTTAAAVYNKFRMETSVCPVQFYTTL